MLRRQPRGAGDADSGGAYGQPDDRTLAAGGMGQVCRARDTRLNRTVAVKAMHDLFVQHPERVARFEREAQLLASLNHPNIAAIHGLEQADGASFLVVEFVDPTNVSGIMKVPASAASRIASSGSIAPARSIRCPCRSATITTWSSRRTGRGRS